MLKKLGNAGFPNLNEELELCKMFLTNFQDEADGTKKYLTTLDQVSQREVESIEIELDDVLSYEGNEAFVRRIECNTLRYIELFSRAADALMPEVTIDVDKADAFDVWLHHRKTCIGQIQDRDEEKSILPSELLRKFVLRIIPRAMAKEVNLRSVKAQDVGRLVKIRGIITRVSDVQPRVQVVTYICYSCGHESYQTTPGTSFKPLTECPSSVCKQNQTVGKLYAHTRGSKFLKYQEIRIQELPHQVPHGNIPRSMTARVYGSCTRMVIPGDIVTMSGIFLPTPSESNAWRQSLISDTYVHVTQLVNHRKTSTFDLTDKLKAEIERKSKNKNIYDQLAASIAPEIYGHEDVKKAMLLLLVSGVTRKMSDGMSIRGDINILLVGDPGVAKSQLLKHTAKLAPRAIYTTGKGSSGVGLTAAVHRDKVTGEVSLEGGALVLADMGICCIDEFDKMEETDRTAIHEVMEQQSVSIAKGGITTTLNARTAILAAANPVYGRWNNSKSFEVNLNLETALLSRFDLIFVLLDKPDEEDDAVLARHITYVHRENMHPPLLFKPFSEAFIRGYLTRASEFQPYIPEDLTDYIVGTYVSMRHENTGDSLDLMMDRAPMYQYRGRSNPRNDRKRFCTPRVLLSILRLSQALARLYFRDVVHKSDVNEAIRLMNVSRAAGLDLSHNEVVDDPKTSIWEIIKKFAKDYKLTEINVSDLLPRVLRQGFQEEQFQETLEEYESLAVWSLNRDRTVIRFISADGDL